MMTHKKSQAIIDRSIVRVVLRGRTKADKSARTTIPEHLAGAHKRHAKGFFGCYETEQF
jgi:hypothetical protein